MIAGVSALLAAYRSGATTPRDVVEDIILRLRESEARGVWISLVEDSVLRARAAELMDRASVDLPLYGVPFAIKDNIDLLGSPTSAACTAFTHMPRASAHVVQKLLDAGAIAIGKTNLDQFATGLVGTRSPYGVCHNSFDPDYISGGSSSGSAVAVALGLAGFALGSDTAGSGRIPAAFNNLVGYKPTLGLLSSRGMVPACRTLDTISILALTADDAMTVARAATGFDAHDPYSRHALRATSRGWSQRAGFRFAVPYPAQREFFGNEEYARLYEQSIDRLSGLGGVACEVDIEPLLETAHLLYQGPWVAERYLAVEALLTQQPEALLPVTRQIIEAGARPSARDAFAAQYKLQALRRTAEAIWAAADLLLLPTAGTHYRIEDIDAEPVALNTRLGHYTNFVNLMDLAAVAVPAGFTARGLPFGITLVAPAFSDEDLLQLAARVHQATGGRLGALDLPLPPTAEASAGSNDTIDVAVCGAHMSGLPLNKQLTSRGAWLVAVTSTAPDYRLYALPGGPPHRPGLVRVGSDGAAIEIEIWRMPAEHFGSFVAGIPSPLGIGRVKTQHGVEVSGFVCESLGTAAAVDITRYGGWRGFLAAG